MNIRYMIQKMNPKRVKQIGTTGNREETGVLPISSTHINLSVVPYINITQKGQPVIWMLIFRER